MLPFRRLDRFPTRRSSDLFRRRSANNLPINNLERHTLPDNLCGTCNGFNAYTDVRRIKQPVDLRSTGGKPLGHGILCDLLVSHCLFNLPGNEPLKRNRFALGKNSLFFEEVIERRATMIESLGTAHFNPRWCFALLLRASFKSSSGVFAVFLMKPCNKIMRFRRSM